LFSDAGRWFYKHMTAEARMEVTEETEGGKAELASEIAAVR
jgi:hypothetical protein